MPKFVSKGLPVKRPVSKQDPVYVAKLKEAAQKEMQAEIEKGKSKSSVKKVASTKEAIEKKEEKKSSEKKK